MAKIDDTSFPHSGRNHAAENVPAETHPPGHGSNERPRLRSIEQTIAAERSQLLQAEAVIHCLSEVLLYTEGEHSIRHADAARLAARLIDESVERLDPVRLKPLLEGTDAHVGGAYEVRDIRGAYVC
jgi:hypothetical protein